MTNLTNENILMLSELSKDFIKKSTELINEKLKEIKTLSPSKEQEEIFNVIDENIITIKKHLEKLRNLKFSR